MNNIFSEGTAMSSQRSLMRALGWTDSEMKKPIIGIICAQSEIIPGHMYLDKIAEAVKEGVIAAGGKPVVVPSIGVCDGIAMGHAGMRYSLPSREVIADSAEILARAHAFSGIVFVGNCDKIIPGMLMAAVRLNLPAPSFRAGRCWRARCTAEGFPSPPCSRRWAPTTPARSTKRSCTNTSAPPARPAAPARACSRRTASTA